MKKIFFSLPIIIFGYAYWLNNINVYETYWNLNWEQTWTLSYLIIFALLLLIFLFYVIFMYYKNVFRKSIELFLMIFSFLFVLQNIHIFMSVNYWLMAIIWLFAVLFWVLLYKNYSYITDKNNLKNHKILLIFLFFYFFILSRPLIWYYPEEIFVTKWQKEYVDMSFNCVSNSSWLTEIKLSHKYDLNIPFLMNSSVLNKVEKLEIYSLILGENYEKNIIIKNNFKELLTTYYLKNSISTWSYGIDKIENKKCDIWQKAENYSYY